MIHIAHAGALYIYHYIFFSILVAISWHVYDSYCINVKDDCKKFMIKFKFYLKRTPHKRKTLFSLNYFSSSVGAKEWVTGEAQLGLLELYPWKRKGKTSQSNDTCHTTPPVTPTSQLGSLLHFGSKTQMGLSRISGLMTLHITTFLC